MPSPAMNLTVGVHGTGAALAQVAVPWNSRVRFGMSMLPPSYSPASISKMAKVNSAEIFAMRAIIARLPNLVS